MRTTIRLDDQLLKEAKRAAAATGRTLTELIEDAVREVLARRRASGKRKPVALRTFRGTGVQPGVDLDDSAGLVELMERRNAPSRR